MTDTLKWRCTECDTVFESTDERHSMDYCPECGEQYVDHESEYVRRSLGVESVDSA